MGMGVGLTICKFREWKGGMPEWELEGFGILKTIPHISICVSFHSLPNFSDLFSPCQLFDIMPNAGNNNLVKFTCFLSQLFDRVCVAILHRTLWIYVYCFWSS